MVITLIIAYGIWKDGNFEAYTYNAGDNDDISAQSLKVFEVMRNLSSTTVDDYNNSFKNGLASDIQSSVNDIYYFMYCDLINFPTARMKSAQIKNFYGNIQSSTQIVFNWNAQSYSSKSSYRNLEDGYNCIIKMVRFGN